MDVKKIVRGCAGVVVVAMLLGSCVSYSGVQRIESNRNIDLSGRWNDTDSRDVAAAMIDQILEGRWLTAFRRGNRDTPSVVVGTVLNRTHEHIATNTFVTDVERALINSGDVRVLQGGEFREQLRAERADQQEFASAATAARLGVEIGADFILQGTISSIVDSSGRQQLIFYQVDLELTSVETAEKVWIGSHQIRKLVTR